MHILHSAALGAAYLALAALPADAQGLIVTRVDSDAALGQLLPQPAVRAQARAGNKAWGGTHELSITELTGGPPSKAQQQWKNGQTLPFRVTYDGLGYLAFDVGGRVVTREVDATFSALALRAASTRKGTSMRATDLRLNHSDVGESLLAAATPSSMDVDALVVQGPNLQLGFVLRGQLRLAWEQGVAHGDQLTFDVWLGDLAGVEQDYCSATPNSAGTSCDLDWSGQTSISTDSLALSATGGVPHAACLFIASDSAQSLPFGNGWLCVGPNIARLSSVLNFDASGAVGFAVPLATGALAEGPLAVAPGDLRTFQLWYRDPQGPPEFFNLSDALALTFLP
jgi:hypothetical protein